MATPSPGAVTELLREWGDGNDGALEQLTPLVEAEHIISVWRPTGTADRLSDEQLRAIYDQGYVDQYDPHAVQRMRRMLPFFELSGSEVVADFGCGNGVLLELIAPRVRDYVGVDFSEEFIRAAERRRDARSIGKGTFQCADLVEFGESHPSQFDAAFALDFSEHIYDDQFVRIFRAIHRALKPDGSLYLHTPNRDYFMERLRERGVVLKQIEGHVAVRTARSNQALLEQCGFAGVQIRYLAHYLRVGGALHGLSALPGIGRYFQARLFIHCRKAEAPPDRVNLGA
jgi:2-polyprenyl-6-hydroxyphenyl methylase / 3-demethylubiquinone-9 3-methyltransferase